MVVDEKAQSQSQSKLKIKVDGQELEISQEEAIELAQKGKDYTKKTQALAEQEKALKVAQEEVAGFKAIVDEMNGDPKLKDTLNKVYSDYKSGKISKSEDVKDRNLKKLDKLIEDTSEPAVREQLRDLREIIKEETSSDDVKSLKEVIGRLENKVSLLENATLIGNNERVDLQVQKIEEKFGKELVDKHIKDIKVMALKYPNQSVEKLLFHFADISEIETALINRAKAKEKEELDKKKRQSSTSGSGDSFTAKTPLTKDKFGRVKAETIWQRVRERLGRD